MVHNKCVGKSGGLTGLLINLAFTHCISRSQKIYSICIISYFLHWSRLDHARNESLHFKSSAGLTLPINHSTNQPTNERTLRHGRLWSWANKNNFSVRMCQPISYALINQPEANQSFRVSVDRWVLSFVCKAAITASCSGVCPSQELIQAIWRCTEHNFRPEISSQQNSSVRRLTQHPPSFSPCSPYEVYVYVALVVL